MSAFILVASIRFDFLSMVFLFVPPIVETYVFVACCCF